MPISGKVVRVKRRHAIIAILSVQAFCTILVVAGLALAIRDGQAASAGWRTREVLELGAALGLILGVVLGGVVLYDAGRAREEAEEKLRRAGTAFHGLLRERFDTWGLTPAEGDVAMFAIKGLSTQEIALMRQTSEGTVKAQTNAIYRKAGVSGRPQLLSLIIEEMIEGRPVERMEFARAG